MHKKTRLENIEKALSVSPQDKNIGDAEKMESELTEG